MGAAVPSSYTCLAFVRFLKFSAVLFLFLRYYFCCDNTSLRAFIAVDSNRILDIGSVTAVELSYLMGIAFTGVPKLWFSEPLGSLMCLGDALNFINAWLLVILFRFCIQKLLCND